jgi:histidinol-phosphate aminotransferase
LFVKVHEDSAELAEKMLRVGVIVKPWRERGYTDHIRITIGESAANDHMLQAFRASAVQSEAMTAQAAF